MGLDLSLQSTGVADALGVSVIKPKAALKGTRRIRWITEQILERAAGMALDVVVVEGASYGSKYGKEHERGGLWWHVAVRLEDYSIPLAVCPPASLKLYATGKGNGSKDQVLISAVKAFAYPHTPTGNDEADALWLRAMGCDRLGSPVVEVPASHRKALDGVAWPEHGPS